MAVETNVEKKLEDFWKLIREIELAQLTTRAPDGSLVARPMATLERGPAGDIWFMTSVETHKVHEIEADPQVNVAYMKGGEWVSVSGTARVVRDPALIQELYKPEWRAWLGDQGGELDGGPDDPRIALLAIAPMSASYFVRTTSKPIAMLRIARAVVGGEPPRVGETRHLDTEDFHHFG